MELWKNISPLFLANFLHIYCGKKINPIYQAKVESSLLQIDPALCWNNFKCLFLTSTILACFISCNVPFSLIRSYVLTIWSVCQKFWHTNHIFKSFQTKLSEILTFLSEFSNAIFGISNSFVRFLDSDQNVRKAPDQAK